MRRGLELLELGHGDVVAVQDAHRALVAVPVAVVGRAEHRHDLKPRGDSTQLNDSFFSRKQNFVPELDFR